MLPSITPYYKLPQHLSMLQSTRPALLSAIKTSLYTLWVAGRISTLLKPHAGYSLPTSLSLFTRQSVPTSLVFQYQVGVFSIYTDLPVPHHKRSLSLRTVNRRALGFRLIVRGTGHHYPTPCTLWKAASVIVVIPIVIDASFSRSNALLVTGISNPMASLRSSSG